MLQLLGYVAMFDILARLVENNFEDAIDRHIEKRGNQTAFIWEGDEPGHPVYVTYKEALAQTCRLANVLKYEYGVRKGDRVAIYMPMIPDVRATATLLIVLKLKLYWGNDYSDFLILFTI